MPWGPSWALCPSCDPLRPPIAQDLLSIVASVLHLGNIHFAADEESNAQVTTENQLKYLTRVSGLRSREGRAGRERGSTLSPAHPLPWQLLGVEGSTLREALTHRKIIAKGEEVRPGLCLRAGGRRVQVLQGLF